MVTEEMKTKASNIIAEKEVNVAFLKECFKWPDDPFLLKVNPNMCKGLYIYNTTYEPRQYWRVPLNIDEYNFLKVVLTNE